MKHPKQLIFLFLFLFLILNIVSAQIVTNSFPKIQKSSNIKYFTDLMDVPNTYSGAGGQCVQVNAGATGLTFATCSSGSGGNPFADQQVNITSNVTHDYITATHLFRGLFDWNLSSSTYATFNGSTFSFLSSATNFWYNQTLGGNNYVNSLPIIYGVWGAFNDNSLLISNGSLIGYNGTQLNFTMNAYAKKNLWNSTLGQTCVLNNKMTGIGSTGIIACAADLTTTIPANISFLNTTETYTANKQWNRNMTANNTINVLRLAASNATNNMMDRCTLVGGACKISNTGVTANTNIFCFEQSQGGTIGSIGVNARASGDHYNISSSNILDTSVVACMLVEPTVII